MFTWLGTMALGRALKGVGGAIVAVLKWFGQGLVVCVQHPVTFFVILVGFGVGWGWGHHYGTVELRKLNKEIVEQNEALDEAVSAADAARRKAEENLVKQIAADTAPQEPPAEAVPAGAPVARARPVARKPLVRVRSPSAVATAGSWLPSFLVDPPQRD